VSSEKSPRHELARTAFGNADYQWAEFDSETYFQHFTASRIPTTTALSSAL